MPLCMMCRRVVPTAPTFTAKSALPVAHVDDKGEPCSMRPNEAYDQEVLELIDQEDQFWDPELQRGSDPASVPTPQGPEGDQDARTAPAGSQALDPPRAETPRAEPEPKKNKSKKRKQNGKTSTAEEAIDVDTWDPGS